MGLGACSYPSIRKQAIVENTSKEMILYSINKQDNYSLVHKNAKEADLPIEVPLNTYSELSQSPKWLIDMYILFR